MDEMTRYPEGLPQAEFDAALQRLEELFRRTGAAMQEAAALLATLSRVQLRKVKQRFKGLLASDYIEKLVLFGTNKMPAHWALPMKPGIRASTWRVLPQKARIYLSDPEATVELMTKQGLKIRRATELTSMELQQVLDPDKGILLAKAQVDRFVQPVKELDKLEKSDNAFVFDSLRRNDNGDVLVFGRSKTGQAGTQEVSILVPFKTLKALLK